MRRISLMQALTSKCVVRAFQLYCIVLYLKGPATPRGDRQRGGGTYAPHLPDPWGYHGWQNSQAARPDKGSPGFTEPVSPHLTWSTGFSDMFLYIYMCACYLKSKVWYFLQLHVLLSCPAGTYPSPLAFIILGLSCRGRTPSPQVFIFFS